jgi:hypothetical protein
MSELWMDSDKGAELLSDIDPEGFDEACSMVYNLHEDAKCLKQENIELKQRLVKASRVKTISRADCAYCGGNESWAEHDAKVARHAYLVGCEHGHNQTVEGNYSGAEEMADDYAQALRDKEGDT